MRVGPGETVHAAARRSLAPSGQQRAGRPRGFSDRDAFDPEAYDDEGERQVVDCVGDGDGVAVYNLGTEVTMVGRVP